MDWTKPLNSRNQVDKAGIALSGQIFWNRERLWALAVMRNWRAAHSFPLNRFQNSLRSRALAFGGEIIIGQRLKRQSSIIKKLRRQQTSTLELSQMQDIGGCRAVMDSVEKVKGLAQIYLDGGSKRFAHELVGAGKDYISSPKPDGYRGIHLVYRYKGGPATQAWDRLRIEIQIRSALQHTWAMAVETVDIFTDQALKSNEGSDDWRRFFSLMGTVIAMKENCPLVPGTPSDLRSIIMEILDLEVRLKVVDKFHSYSTIVREINKINDRNGYYLIHLDFDSREVKVETFGWYQSEEANERYGALESMYPNAPVVLVKSSSIAGLKKSYPSYFLDSSAFVGLIGDVLGGNA